MELTRLDFPGYVQNIEKAVNMLGGSHAIFQSITSKDTPLKINFRPNDQLGHEISSSSSDDPCILLKIKRLRKYKIVNGEKQLIGTEYVAEFVGRSSQTFEFNQPSDFQFLPALQSPYNQPTVVDPPPQSFLYLPPQRFLHNYKYKASYIQRRIFAAQQEQMKTWKKSECPWIINQQLLFTLKNGPSPSEPASDINHELLSLLQVLFDERPIWTVLAIFDKFSTSKSVITDLKMNENSPVFFHTLACVAYFVRNGPFKMCWVKYGVNPIAQKELSIYQTIVLSLKTWEYADEISKRITRTSKYIPRNEEVPTGISSLNAIPNKLFYAIQICDLRDSYPTQMSQMKLDSYNRNHGWYHEEIITNIRKFCLLKLQRLLKDSKKVNPNILMADINSNVDLAKEISRSKESQKKIDFDFLFVNDFQGILGICETNLDNCDYQNILGKKFTFMSCVDRINNY